jgi:hypothetical protein
MKHLILALTICTVLASCRTNDVPQKAEDAEDAAREFIRASLDGNYDRAEFYLYQDSVKANQMIMDKWKADYDHLSNADKVNFKDASILVKNIEKVNDSISHFTYSNSYKNVQQTIKVIRFKGDWLVDLKDIH